MLSLAFWILLQGIDAGPVAVSCDGSPVTLTAIPYGLGMPVPEYFILWDGAGEAYEHYVAAPTATTQYHVTLSVGINTYEDWVTVLVHPGDPDLNHDGMQNDADWNTFFAGWAGPVDGPGDLDPDLDGRVSILDWFYICNFQRNPINTPPTLSVTSPILVTNSTVIVPTMYADGESAVTLRILDAPMNGSAFFTSGNLRYQPFMSFMCNDDFVVDAWDGVYNSPPRSVSVMRLQVDDWTDLHDEIFFPICRDCHLLGNTEGMFSMDTYASAMAGGQSMLPGFTPYQPQNSQIYVRTAAGDMPKGGPPLTSEQLSRILDWINAGALEHNICP
ncbi:MAG: hypothetical protein H6510_00805 [Acidobacteria bacterium]|nr:hypothetical protein [Acidobacteriota bacterium]MCB9396327.1 hypothetical protein [Acidobacteriota bacterium]